MDIYSETEEILNRYHDFCESVIYLTLECERAALTRDEKAEFGDELLQTLKI